MNNKSSLNQSIIIGVLSGVLALALGVAAFVYFKSKNQPQPIVQEKAVKESKALQLPSNEAALKELFGMSDPSGKVKTAPYELVSFWFEKSFKVGTDNVNAKFFAIQKLDESGQPIESHATGVEIGVITYKQNSDQWMVVSKQQKFGMVASWGTVDGVKPEVLQLSPESLAVMLNSSDGMGGTNFEGSAIFVFSKNSWHDVGSIETGGDNSGTMDDKQYSYKGVISVVAGSESDYPNLLVTRTGTEMDKEEVIPAKNVTYIFKDGKYINPKAVSQE